MRILLLINQLAIALLGMASGCYKIAGGAADVEIFGAIGLSARQTAIFGAIQLIAAIMVLWQPYRFTAGIVLALCYAFATYALFAGRIQPFGAISILFILMALVAASS